MKKVNHIIFFIIIFIFILNFPINCQATDNNQILEEQTESLNISSFIKEAQKYTNENFSDLDIEQLFTGAINGKIDNKAIIKVISNVMGKEVVNCIEILGSILIIVIIHSVLKSISESLENKTISQITYYVQYILIATLIMSNFTDILNMVKSSINNLIGFMNSLIPLLITLMLTTR